MHVLEAFNVNDVVEEEEVVGPNCFVVDSCHHELEYDYFIYSLEDNHGSEFVDQLVEEQVDVPLFMFDDIANVVDLLKYDEYDDDYIVDFEVDSSEQPTTCSQS